MSERNPGWVVLDGVLAPATDVLVPFACGLSAGEGALEVFRTTPHGPFLARRHIERLSATCQVLGIPSPPGIDGLRSDLATLPVQDAGWRLRLVVTDNGRGGTLRALEATPLSLDTQEAAKVVVREGRVTALPGFKTTSYAASRHFVRVAKASGAQECIMTDRGLVLEGATSNVFLVSGGSLVTPNKECILAGITRGRVMELAAELGVATEERDVTIEELEAADEVFFTSSVRGLQPVSSIGDRQLGLARPVTRQLLDTYNNDLNADWGELRVEWMPDSPHVLMSKLLAVGGALVDGGIQLQGVRLRTEPCEGGTNLALERTHRGAGESLVNIAAAVRALS